MPEQRLERVIRGRLNSLKALMKHPDLDHPDLRNDPSMVGFKENVMEQRFKDAEASLASFASANQTSAFCSTPDRAFRSTAKRGSSVVLPPQEQDPIIAAMEHVDAALVILSLYVHDTAKQLVDDAWTKARARVNPAYRREFTGDVSGKLRALGESNKNAIKQVERDRRINAEAWNDGLVAELRRVIDVLPILNADIKLLSGDGAAQIASYNPNGQACCRDFKKCSVSHPTLYLCLLPAGFLCFLLLAILR